MVSRDANQPIVFQAFGESPDTCLDVFGYKFYVHSRILKLHSAFFRKFINSNLGNGSGRDDVSSKSLTASDTSMWHKQTMMEVGANSPLKRYVSGFYLSYVARSVADFHQI